MEQDVNWLVQKVATTLLGNSNSAGQSQPKLLAGKALSSLSPNRCATIPHNSTAPSRATRNAVADAPDAVGPG